MSVATARRFAREAPQRLVASLPCGWRVLAPLVPQSPFLPWDIRGQCFARKVMIDTPHGLALRRFPGLPPLVRSAHGSVSP